MKLKLLCAFIFSSVALLAQQNQTKKIVKIQGNDTTIIMINSRIDQMDSILAEEMKKVNINDSLVTRVDVFIDTTIIKASDSDANSDTTQIKIGKMKIVILDSKNSKEVLDDLPKGERKIIIDEKVIIENDEDFSWTPKNGEAELRIGESEDQNTFWTGLGINSNGFVNTALEFTTAEQLGFLALDPAKSLGIQFNFAQKRFPIINEYLGVVTGMGVQWNRFALKGAYEIAVVNDTLVGIATGLNYSKNVLTSTYLQAPLLLQISTCKNPNTAWHISAGIVGGLRLGARQTQKWEADGKKNKDKTKDDFQFNPFQASLMAIIGYDDWSLYASYGLSDVFNQGSAIKVRGVNAGILLSF